MTVTRRTIIVKSLVIHTVTYVFVGLIAFFTFDYRHLFADGSLRSFMRPIDSPLVIAGALFQPIRGALFGVLFQRLQAPLFEHDRGWLTLWLILLVVGIIGPFGPPPGSLEGLIYTLVPIRIQLMLLPEVILQSLLLSAVLFYWVRHPNQRLLNGSLWTAFAVSIALPLLGVVSALSR